MCCAFSADDTLLVVGYYDGLVASFDLHAMSVRHETSLGRSGQGKPAAVTAIAVRPTRGGAKPGYLVATTQGDVLRMDGALTAGDTAVAATEVTYSCDYNADGTYFATAGHDATIRVYRDQGAQLLQQVHLAPEYATNVAALRLFSIRFDPDNTDRYFAGGWSNTVYEHRVSADPETKPIEYFGAYVTGEAIDVCKGLLVTASHRLDDPVQMWDMESRKPTTLTWPVRHCFLPSCARLSCDGRFVGVGGAGGEGLDAGFFAVDLSTGKPVIDVKVEKAVTACAFARAEALVAFCDAEGQIQVYENRFANRSAAAGSAVAAVRA
jgi:WD40 repeat protein